MKEWNEVRLYQKLKECQMIIYEVIILETEDDDQKDKF